MLTLPGYQILEQINDSANSTVLRAHNPQDSTQRLDTKPVILKLLKGDYPSPERIALFKREYNVLRSLNPLVGPGVVDVYSLDHIQHHWVMVLEDFGGNSLNLLGLSP